MIYIDSSVVLARLLFEHRSPPLAFWEQRLISSRLLEYEIWTRVHAYDQRGVNAAPARALLAGVELLEMDRPVLARALAPWPLPLRTLDALHLATLDHLRQQGEIVQLASYDNRLVAAAHSLGIAIVDL